MNKELIKKEISDDEYQSLLDDCGSAITEGVVDSRWKLIETYHIVGARIREECPKPKDDEPRKDGIVNLLKRLAVDLRKSQRTLYNAVSLFDQYPDLNDLPDGKNISWHKICNKHLEKSKEKKENRIECPECGHKWNINN